jgi:tetratricopeptide (TPR) repeat protein
LLLRANRQLSTTDLIAAGWGTPEVSPAQLHKAISALRKVFLAVERPDALTTHNRFGYALTASDEDLDMLSFVRLVERADACRVAPDPEQEIACLHAALALWRSDRPLANVPIGAFEGEIDALRRRRKRGAVRLFTLEIARGAYAAASEDLAAFVAEYPEDAQLCRLLMIALYLDGHAEDATAVHERYEEVSASPDLGLRRLAYAMVTRNDEAVARAAGTPLSPVAVPQPRQLRPPPPFFVGRAGLLAEVTWLLREPRLPVLAISGPGGMGKTALALRAAHDAAEAYPDGQLWADLRGTTGQPADAGEVLAEFLRALGAPAVPETRRERAGLFRSTLADRRVLVVLDDASDGAQVRDLLPGGGRCVVLITSRRRMPDVAAPTHQVAPLGALDDDTAGELFRQIVTAGNVDLAGEEDAAGEVVRMCGGLPLAVRMAALLRVESFHRSTADLRRRLAAQGTTAFAYGEESLARTLGAGLAPLDDRARRLFLGLGLLALPTFGEWTAAAVLDETGPAAGEALTQLAAVGMIEAAPGTARYRFHDLTREYARGLAASSPVDGLAGVPARVCAALLSLTRHAHIALYGEDFDVAHSDVSDVPVPKGDFDEAVAEPLVWFEQERLNIRAAVSQAAEAGRADLCWDLAVSAHEFYAIGAYFDDWRVTHEVALAACRRAGDRRGEGIVLTMLGQPPLVASGTPGVSGVAELETAVRLLGESGESHGRAVAQRTLANALRRRGELTRPLVLFTEALVHYQRSGDLVGSQQSLRFIGQTHLVLGDPASAVAVLREAEKIARAGNQPRVLAPTLYWMGQARLALGDLSAAAAAFDEVLAASPPSTGVAHAYALHGLGELALALGEADTARGRLEKAEAFAHDGPDVALEGRVCLSIAAVEASLGRHAERAFALLRALEPIRASGAAYLEVQAQAELASTYDRLGDADAAAAARDRVTELYARGDVPLSDRLFVSR